MGGWYAMIMDAGSDSASSATRVVRLPDSRRSEGACRVRGLVNRDGGDSLDRQQDFMHFMGRIACCCC